jgi:septum site-determining protein MinD
MEYEGKIYGIVALKGGVGKTTVCANLGTALAIGYDKKVLIIDANFSTPHLGLHVGIVNPDRSLHKIMEDEYSVYEGIYEHALGFHVIPGMLAPEGLDYHRLKEKIEPLREYYDYILIDSSPSLNQEMAATMSASDEVLVVSSPDYPTLSSTLHAIKIARNQGTDVRGIILNKVRKKRFELNSKDVSEASDVKVLASIPDEVKVQAALAKMIPIVAFSPSNEVSNVYKRLAASLAGETYRKSLFGKKKKKGKKKDDSDEE